MVIKIVAVIAALLSAAMAALAAIAVATIAAVAIVSVANNNATIIIAVVAVIITSVVSVAVAAVGTGLAGEALGAKAMRNTSGGSYRALPAEKKTWSDARWKAEFVKDVMLIKRPILEKDGVAVKVGFRGTDDEIASVLLG